ncbi:hypothetical protein TeGR_g5389, partial [Tetraparma gracilis]
MATNKVHAEPATDNGAYSSLTTLDLRNTRVSDISPISSCAATLELLGLSATPVTDISGVGSCGRLKCLFLVSSNVSDLSPLRRCGNLEVLDCSGSQVEDVTPLSECGRLKDVMLVTTRVRSVEPLANLERLQKLNLNFSGVTSALVTAANFFIISSFLVGPVAAIFKLTVNTDLRGRVAELVTVVATISTAFHCYGPLSLLIISNTDSCSGVERQLTAPPNIIPFTAPLAVTVKEALASFPQTPVVVLGAALAQ